ncbi:FadR/GntR family transcriptional regulator [Asticcacaulis sp.]|uniref:FadR/GntR family transcriptional regulator n=1 Tax=Asticcacaulis sp. TaxID=1872648 RepID=UPI002B98CF14|nr:FadR/GntR family transcriptional regulator [Asticcacaulis sp.]HTM81534.1 FadR/GntR family transcriptional regulator [Asticcacaulis sp.]
MIADKDDMLEVGTTGEGMVDRVVRSVIAMIRSDDLRVGDALPGENTLATRFGVSRAVVREAFRSLSALRILDIGNGRNARIAVPDSDTFGLLFDHVVHTRHVTVQQVLDVRRSIEVRTVVLAAVRRTEREAQTILQCAAGMRDNFEDPALVLEHDLQMHAAIAEAARNPMFTIMVKSFEAVTRNNWTVGWKSRESEQERMKMISVHEAIAQAVADQDVEGARTAMSAHFDETIRALAIAGFN